MPLILFMMLELSFWIKSTKHSCIVEEALTLDPTTHCQLPSPSSSSTVSCRPASISYLLYLNHSALSICIRASTFSLIAWDESFVPGSHPYTKRVMTYLEFIIVSLRLLAKLWIFRWWVSQVLNPLWDRITAANIYYIENQFYCRSQCGHSLVKQIIQIFGLKKPKFENID